MKPWDHIVRICKDKRRIRYCAMQAMLRTTEADKQHSFLKAIEIKTRNQMHVTHNEAYAVEKIYRSYVLNQPVHSE